MKKILIVDDDNEIQKSLSVLLEEAGYAACGVSSGRDALENIASGDFDVVLLDIMMPGMSGLDVIAELRRRSPKTQVIMITAFPAVDSAIDAIRKGASDYISKPFRCDELLSKIGRVIEEARFEEHFNRPDLNYVLNSIANPIRRSILKLISSGPGMRLPEIAEELNINDHSKIIFHLKMLKEAEMIEQDNEKSYFLAPEGEKVLECLRIIESHLPN